jgi:hypothetical protein
MNFADITLIQWVGICFLVVFGLSIARWVVVGTITAILAVIAAFFVGVSFLFTVIAKVTK